MARYTGPTTKIARKFGEPIFGSDKNFEKRNYPPGQHGLASKRKKQREYGIQLKEKQKVRYMYGLLERQFHNTYLKASRMAGQKGENLLFLLESRLDNVVYRMGIAPSRGQEGHRQPSVRRSPSVHPSEDKCCRRYAYHLRPGPDAVPAPLLPLRRNEGYRSFPEQLHRILVQPDFRSSRRDIHLLLGRRDPVLQDEGCNDRDSL